jgi:hypothetical protein
VFAKITVDNINNSATCQHNCFSFSIDYLSRQLGHLDQMNLASRQFVPIWVTVWPKQTIASAIARVFWKEISPLSK